jgi:hypothetical protein
MQEPEHAMNRTDSDHRLARVSVPFVIATVSPISTQPGESTLDNPAPCRSLTVYSSISHRRMKLRNHKMGVALCALVPSVAV